MKIMAHSNRDAWLVALVPLHLGLVLYGVARFESLSWAALAGLGAAVVFLTCTNFQCVGHNFIHNPFFVSDRANRLFSIVNTLALGLPQTLYRVHHLHHHKYNNDKKDPSTGTTRDRTSTFRFSSDPDREESLVRYAALGVFRTGLGFLVDGVRKNGTLGLTKAEAAAFAAGVGGLLVLSWKGALFFYLPVWYLGQVSAQAENYLEHHGAIPGNRLTDSVSCYGRLYNLVWFNNGYHQEHHYRPQVHWTRLPELLPLMLPESARRVVRGAHWLNFTVAVRTARPVSESHAG